MKKWVRNSILGGLFFLFLLFATSQIDKEKEQLSPQQKEAVMRLLGKSSYLYEIVSFQTSWKTVARGSAVSEGMLWVPEIQLTVKNTGTRDIDAIYFKAVFFDAEGVITGDDIIESINQIPSGHARGPIFMNGTVGYTSDIAFSPMMKDDSRKWSFDLFEGNRYSGPWKKTKTGKIELPGNYRE